MRQAALGLLVKGAGHAVCDLENGGAEWVLYTLNLSEPVA